MTLAVSALILAGGQSSRMGRDKALIPIKGVPLIRRAYEAAVPHCDVVYVISPWGDRYQSVLPDECQFIPEVMSVNIQGTQASTDSQAAKNHTVRGSQAHTHGPLIAFYQGLCYLQEQSIRDAPVDWILLLACDLPNLQSTVFQRWCDRLAYCPDSTIALLPPHKTKGWHPLCGFYRYCCFPSLRQFVAQGGRSFQRWLVQQEVQALPIDDPSLLFNCNTPSDLKDVTV